MTLHRSNVLLGAALLACLALAPGGAAGAPSDATPIKIGFLFPFTGGGLAEVSEEVGAALDTYVRQHGDTVAGRKIEIIRRDDTGLAPEVARRNAQELVVGEHVDFLAGEVFSPNAVAIAQISTQAHVPFLIVNSGSAGLLDNDPYTLRIGFTNRQLVGPLARWVVQSGIKSSYAAYQDFAAGHEMAGLFAKAFSAQGGSIVGEVTAPISTTDYTAYALRIRDASPQGVFAFVGGGYGVFFIKAAAQLGFAQRGIKIYSASGLVDPNDLAVAGDAALGTIYATDYTPYHNSALNREFVKQFKATLGKDRVPDYASVAAYDAIDAIYRVVAQQKGNVDPDKSLELLRNLSFESPRGPLRIDPKTREAIENVYIVRIDKSKTGLVPNEIATFPMVNDATAMGGQ